MNRAVRAAQRVGEGRDVGELAIGGNALGCAAADGKGFDATLRGEPFPERARDTLERGGRRRRRRRRVVFIIGEVVEFDEPRGLGSRAIGRVGPPVVSARGSDWRRRDVGLVFAEF